MKLEISSFAEVGNLEKERVILRATEDVDIGDFVILRSKIGSNGGPTSGRKDVFWLPDVNVKGGDLVVVYTRKGKNSTKQLDDDRTAHFFYWHQKGTFWGPEDKNVAVVIEARTWTSKDPSARSSRSV